jgi:hypothetical protein
MDADSLDTILSLIKQMEATLIGLKQLRGYVGQGVAQHMLQVLIDEMESGLSEVKRKLLQ